MTPQDPEVNEIGVAEALERVRGQRGWLLDVREDDEWEAGHSEHGHHIPLGDLENRQSELPVDQDILVVCRSGGRSRVATVALSRAGFPASNVLGGMTAWQRAGGDVLRNDGNAGRVV